MNRFILLIFLTIPGLSAFSQNLDRISISSGGKATNEVNFVIGETFNFTVAGNGNITIETGSMGSTQNTGASQNYVSLKQVALLKNIACYPNPATDAVYFTLNSRKQSTLFLHVFDMSGKLIKSSETENREIMKIDLQSIAPGTFIATVSDLNAGVLGSFQFIKK